MGIVAERPPAKYSAEGLLGIKASNNLGLAIRVRSGLSFASFERLSRATGLPMDVLRSAVRISARTMTRRRSEKRLSPEESDRLVAISRLLAQSIELFDGNVAAAADWMTRPNRALGRESPIEIASTEIGTREVENLIGRLEHGVFS